MPEPLQPMLPSMPQFRAESAIFAAPDSGVATASTLREQQPDRYAMIIRLREQGFGQLRIAKELSMSIHTVRAVLEREGRALFAPEQDNQRAISLFREGRELALERTIEALCDDARCRRLTPDKLALTAAILTDKTQLLSGEATQRIEHTHDTVPAADEFAAFMHAGVIDVESEQTGIEAGTRGQKGALPAGPGPIDGALDEDAAAAAIIAESGDHKMCDQVENGEKATDRSVSGADDVSGDVSGRRGGQDADPGAGVRDGQGQVGGEGVGNRGRPATSR